MLEKGLLFLAFIVVSSTYTDDASLEIAVFSNHINFFLAADQELQQYLPLDASSPTDLFNKMEDGVLLCKMVNLVKTDTIDERVINKGRLNIYKKQENLNLAINGLRAIGCTVINISSDTLMNPWKNPHLVLGLIWQVVRIQLTQKINLKHCPELFRLLKEGEDLNDLLKLSPENILIRWINYHLEKQGSDRRINNLGADLKDSIALTKVLNSLDGSPGSNLDPLDDFERAEIVRKQAQNLGVPDIVTPKDITTGNEKVNTLFCANIFNTKHGLDTLDGAYSNQMHASNPLLEMKASARAIKG